MNNVKICGWKESCFENGKQWGHLEGIMCKHLGEDTCLIDNQEIEFYGSQKEYDKILKEIQP